MNDLPLFPLTNDANWLLAHCRMPLHTGVGKINQHGDPNNALTKTFAKFHQSNNMGDQEFTTNFFLPANGNCQIFLRWTGENRLSRNFGEGLTVIGDSPEGSFHFACPKYYVNSVSERGEPQHWAIASPINCLATLSYGAPRPIAKVSAMINNFDFDSGNLRTPNGSSQKGILRVEGAGRIVDFIWRKERTQLRRLVDAGLIATTSFLSFSFDAWPEATEDDLSVFAHNVASLCSCVIGQHTGIPLLSFLDAEGRVIRKVMGNAIESEYRRDSAFQSDIEFSRFFSQCFNEYCKLEKSKLWKTISSYFASIEDPPYLEK